MISKPYVPSDKIPCILADHLPSRLGAVPKFFQNCLSFWSLKRQIRNGVPLIRRLQSSLHKNSNENSETNDEQRKHMKEQLRYWQRLRHDLERTRMLNEMIIKREKMKTSDIQKGMQMSLIRLSPWTVLLKDLLTELRNLDSQEIYT